MLEAMAAGCLVVGSRTAPVEEVIRDGENGLLVDFFNVKEIAERVIDALSNPGALISISRNARNTVVTNYDLQTICLPAQQRMLSEVMGATTHHATGPMRMQRSPVSSNVERTGS